MEKPSRLSGARFRLTATFFSLVRKEGKNQGLAPLGRILQKPFLLYAPKETVFEIQRKALTGPWVRSSIDRRVKSGHTKRRFPLPLVPTKGALPAAHDRAPNAGACWQQACLEGPAEFYNCQQSGSENGELRASAYPNAGNRTVQHPILDSRNNGGPGVQALLTEAPPLGAEGHPRPTPGVLLPSFRTSEKKVAVRRNLTDRFFWRCQKKWGRKNSISRTQSLQ